MDVDRVKRTFTSAGTYGGNLACLFSVMKYYREDFRIDSFATVFRDNPDDISLIQMRDTAIQWGFSGRIRIYSLEELAVVCTPTLLFFKNELGQEEYVVYYGKYRERFVVGEPSFSLMQYTAQDMEQMWIRGIALVLFPTPEFFT